MAHLDRSREALCLMGSGLGGFVSCLVSGFETACTGSLLYSATGMGWVAESRVEPFKFYEEGFEETTAPRKWTCQI